MEFIEAQIEHKDIVLNLLDQFRTACMKIMSPESNFISDTAVNYGESMFLEVIDSDISGIFLAVENENYIGIITIHLIPQIRKGCYTAEIEEMFVIDEYQGKGVADELMDKSKNRAISKGAKSVRLESSAELKRAHGFYKKCGFINYGDAYELKL